MSAQTPCRRHAVLLCLLGLMTSPRPLIRTGSRVLGVAPVDVSAGLLDDNIGTFSGCWKNTNSRVRRPRFQLAAAAFPSLTLDKSRIIISAFYSPMKWGLKSPTSSNQIASSQGACENLRQFSVHLQGFSSFGFPGRARLTLELGSQGRHGSLEKYPN